MRLWHGFLLLALATVAWAGTFSDELNTERYDAYFTLGYTRGRGAGGVTIELERGPGVPGIRVHVADGLVRLEGQPPVPFAMVDRGSRGLLLARRGGTLLVDAGHGPVVTWTVPRGPGAEGDVTAKGGWTVTESRVVRLDPVCFGDNFMRAADDAGSWRLGAGTWRLQSAWDNDPRMQGRRYANADHSTNPFAWVGAGPSAACTTGLPTWESYDFRVAVRPAADGAVGVLVNLTDPANGLLVRWTPAHGGNALVLQRWTAGTPAEVLATSPGGYLPDRWYELRVYSAPGGVRVSVDGDPRITFGIARPWRGGVGLCAEGAQGCVFDDVSVLGADIRGDLLRESRDEGIGEVFMRGTMREWAARNEWRYAPPGQVRYHGLDYYGDPSVAARVSPGAGVGELRLVLCGDPADASAGCRAVVRALDGPSRVEAVIAQGDAWLANTVTDAVVPGEQVTWRFRREGDTLILERDATEVLRMPQKGAVTGARPGYAASGCFAGASVRVTSARTIDDIFAEAPAGWRGVGTWQSTTRWSCSSEWSFLGGWSRGDAVLWHKQSFTGDQFFEAYVGVKMEVPGEHQVYEDRLRDLCVTICGDGEDPRNGYALAFGADSVDGAPNRRTVLLRKGVVVGESPDVVPPREVQHFEWFGLGLRKTGAVVTATLNGRTIITYTDKAPLAGGVPAIWTTDSGIIVARARLHHANPATAHAATPVVLTEPALPPWGSVGQALALDFAGSWSASGKPVRLIVTPRETADDGKALPLVDGLTVRWTPTKPGAYWYSIVATDGERRSAPFHVSLPVFDPGRGRDDAHALLLYRFDEDDGGTVRDRSVGAPALDLALRNPADAVWIPGVGLRVGRTARLEAANADKLFALAKSKAGTVEVWVSNETKYPPPDKVFTGSLFAWGGSEGTHNLILGHQRASFLVCPPDTALAMDTEADMAAYSYHGGLQHLVVTWDGTATRLYADGALLGTRYLGWSPANWRAGQPIILGGLADGEAPELGTYHLVAVHDRCLTAAEVGRHFAAGPRGR